MTAALGQGVSALAALQVTDADPDIMKPVLHENVATLSCLSPLPLVTEPFSSVIAPVHLVRVQVVVSLGHGVSALAALQVTDAVTGVAKPVLQENVATLVCLSPLCLITDPLFGVVGAPVHLVSVQPLPLIL